MNPGILYATLAYAMWGVYPLYFKALQAVPATEVLMHRMVWAVLVIAVILIVRGRWRWLRDVAANPRMLWRVLLGSALIAFNWLLYIWAVQNDHVLDASLGYFITPLVNVLLGRIALGERPRPVQWTSIAIACCGVVWLAVASDRMPWIALALAVSFGSYGLAKKTMPLGAIEGLALETSVLFPFAAVGLVWSMAAGHSVFLASDTTLQLLLVASGPLTALPLLLFAAGARRIPMTTLGLLQYISPTLQLALGVLVYDEPLGGSRLAGYVLIWLAIALYASESLWHTRRAMARLRPA